ncbi:MAG: class I SAM-dependent methyltransferase [Solirubrobacteraceae bacterium]
MADTPYDTLSEVYDWLVWEGLLTPQGSAAAFGDVLDELEPGSRILDCAAGTGHLAVGLALRGFEVVATDASDAMVQRTRRLAAEHGADLRAATSTWSSSTTRAGRARSTPSSASATRSRTRPEARLAAPRCARWRASWGGGGGLAVRRTTGRG